MVEIATRDEQAVPAGTHDALIVDSDMQTRVYNGIPKDMVVVYFQPKAPEGQSPYTRVSRSYTPVATPLSGLGALFKAVLGDVDFSGGPMNTKALHGKPCRVTIERNNQGFANVTNVESA